jgi:S-adenosylmethionine:tRNA ribosyltransferase-isomerase
VRLEEFDYVLPKQCVAQEPCARRDASRLMVLDRRDGTIEETAFARIGDHLRAGDLLVLNDTRVIPALLRSRKPSGGQVEILLLAREPGDAERSDWLCLVSTGRGLRPGTRLSISDGFEAEFQGEAPGGRVRMRLFAGEGGVEAAIRRHGWVPLPPYIKRLDGDARADLDRERYQTVYARADGAVAAPTAGLHFDEALLQALRAKGVAVARLTLHVGAGTFQPVRVDDVSRHVMHSEWYSVPEATVNAIAAARAAKGRVIAVGTTALRALESAATGGALRAGTAETRLFIVPGYEFRVVDRLVTNFHLPKSTLLMLVSAFAGVENIRRAYAHAVAERYRFFSYGDAMLLERAQ